MFTVSAPFCLIFSLAGRRFSVSTRFRLSNKRKESQRRSCDPLIQRSTEIWRRFVLGAWNENRIFGITRPAGWLKILKDGSTDDQSSHARFHRPCASGAGQNEIQSSQQVLPAAR